MYFGLLIVFSDLCSDKKIPSIKTFNVSSKWNKNLTLGFIQYSDFVLEMNATNWISLDMPHLYI